MIKKQKINSKTHYNSVSCFNDSMNMTEKDVSIEIILGLDFGLDCIFDWVL